MNLVLVNAQELDALQHVRLSGRRFTHIKNVLKAQIGDEISVGLINGKHGKGHVLNINERHVHLALQLDQEAPQPLPLTLILALPRPKMLRRILTMSASLGVETLVLLNCFKVEKSYWSSPVLQNETLMHYLSLGLEQAKACQLPQVLLRKRFKPFVEDELPALVQHKQAIVAHPYVDQSKVISVDEPTVLAVGPEAGFIPYEVEKLQQNGFQSYSSGPRILRVETAIPVLISRLYSHL